MTSSSGSKSSLVCKEVFDEDYQPSTEEIHDYAIKIGINVETEPHLLYLAKDGLMHALPSEWKVCYNDEYHSYYYVNAKTKVKQWDHPLDAEYKQLVDKIRKQLATGDLSEDLSQLDSGIRSLQCNDDSELNTDKSPITLFPQTNTMDNSGSSYRYLNSNELPLKRGIQVLQPIESSIRNKRFEVTNYSNNGPPPPTIGLTIKTSNTNINDGIGLPGSSPNKVSEVEPKGFTLSGTGSIFLKSNSKKNEDNDSNLVNTNYMTEPHGSFYGIGSNVKGILRDSSLTDVRNNKSVIAVDNKIAEASDIEDRKSVRFNLDTKQKILDQFIGSSDDSSDKSGANDAAEEKELSDEEDDDGDGWDFADGDGGVKDIKVTLNPMAMLRRPLKAQHSLDGLKNGTNRIIDRSKQQTIKIGRPNIVTLFERQTIGNDQPIKPLYDDTDSDTSSVKKNVETKESEDLDTVEEETQMTQMKITMQERLNQYKENLDKEIALEEAKLKNEIGNNLEKLKKDKLVSDIQLKELESQKNINRGEIDRLLEIERDKFEENLKEHLEKLRNQNEVAMRTEIEQQRKEFEEKFKLEKNQIDKEHNARLSDISNELELQISDIKNDLESRHNNELENFKQYLKEEFESKRKEISEEHRSAVDKLQKNHAEILSELERDLKTEVELVKKEHTTNLQQLKDKMTYELEMERHRMRESGDYRLYEKIRCEKRLLEDKYRCLKEKYVRLKSDVKLSLERRNRRREQQSFTTGSETERSISYKHSTAEFKNTSHSTSNTPDQSRPPIAPNMKFQAPLFREKLQDKPGDRVFEAKEKKFTAAAKYLSHIQQYHDDTTSVSQSDTTFSNNYKRNKHLPSHSPLADNGNSDSEAFRKNQENNNNTKDNPGRQRKKIFTRLKSASTSRLHSGNNRAADIMRPCTPVENLRRQLQKLEDLEDQFPDSTLDATYHLRYPFSDAGKEHAGKSSELEFFKHRIHLERDSVRRAKDSLRTQRTNFRGRQREVKQRHKSTTRHTIDQLIQEERELTDMEVNLHRTRALLGEKVIRLRHLEQSLQRCYEKEKPFISFLADQDNKVANKEDTTISDLSSHSSSGFSSTDIASETINKQKRKDMYQESSDIIQSLENLNAEIKEIWEILSKQQSHGLPPPPSFMCHGLAWPVMSTAPNGQQTQHQPSIIHQPIPTLADRLETYRQLAANRTATNVISSPATSAVGVITTNSVAANTIVSQSPLAANYTISLVERTQDLRNWLRLAKNEHEMLSSGQQTNL